MSDLWARLAAGVPQRVERWPGNDGEDIVQDTTAANHTMIEAANRIAQLEAALKKAVEQLDRAHSDAFRQAAGYGLVTADGRDFSCYELNHCSEVAAEVRAALNT